MKNDINAMSFLVLFLSEIHADMYVNVFDKTYIDGYIYQLNVSLLIAHICIIIYGLSDNLCYE